MQLTTWYCIHVIFYILIYSTLASAEPQGDQSTITDYDAYRQQNLVIDKEIPTPSSIKKKQLTVQEQREQPLWSLLKNGQLDKLRTAIKTMQSDNPGWQPSLHLTKELGIATQRQQIKAAIETQSNKKIIELSTRYPDRFRCVEVHHLWAQAEAHIQLNETNKGMEVYRQVITSCASAYKRLVTLYKAEKLLPANKTLKLIKLEDQRPSRSESLETKYQDLRYRHYLKAANQKNLEVGNTLFYLKQIEPQIIARRDASTARLFANAYRQSNNEAKEFAWLEQAAKWSGEEQDYLHLLRHYLASGDTANGKRLIKNISNAEFDTTVLKTEMSLHEARYAYQRGDYDETLNHLRAMSGNNESNREAILLSAWSHYHLGLYVTAADEFEILYRQQQDQAIAQGLVFSLYHAKQLQKFIALEQELNGPLTLLLPEDDVIARMQTGKSPAELQLSINDKAHIQILDTKHAESKVTAALLSRGKSGDAGTSQLSLNKLPVIDLHIASSAFTEWSLQLDRVTLDAGSPATGTLIGSDAFGNSGQMFSPTTKLDNGLEGLIRVQHQQGEQTWFAGIGLSTTNGEVDANLQGTIGLTNYSATSGWQGALIKTPVRESILSYSGLRDPFSGQQWGAVSKTAIEVTGYRAINNAWQWSGSATFALLDGDGVKQNQHLGLYAAASRNLSLTDAEEVNFGPYLLAQTYQYNLSKFTLGHGGYFSPQQLIQLGVRGRYLSAEHRDYLWQTDIAIGYQYHKEDSTPYFPLNPNNQNYAENSDRGIATQWDIAAVKNIGQTPWQVGGIFRGRASPQYNDFAGMIFLRYLFTDSRKVLRHDLPHEIFQTLY